MVENLKCCGNCEYRYNDINCNYNEKTNKICNKLSGWKLKINNIGE